MNLDHILIWLSSRFNFIKRGVRHHPMNQCLNCSETLKTEQLFCHNCGQKVHYSKLSVWSLIGEFIGGIFNLENGFYRSLAYLPIPGYLSKKFMEGKRKRFLNPIRFFLVALILHLAVLTDLIPFEEINRLSSSNVEKVGQDNLKKDFETIKDSIQLVFPNCDIDSLEKIIFQTSDFSRDSIHINDPSPEQEIILNTTLFSRGMKFDVGDVYSLPIDTFLVRYDAQNYWERLFMTQFVRTVREPTGAIRFGIGNLVWSILFAIVLTGLFMKLLYIRRNRYYVEHLIVLFNIHSFSFLLASIGLWVGFNFIGPDNNLDDIAYLIIVLFFYVSLKFYYQQGWIKTFIKFIMIGFVYISLLVFMIVTVTVLSLALFK